MASQMTESGTGSFAQTVIEQILHEYNTTQAGGMSKLMERELRVPVTETLRHTYHFSGFHYIDVSIDDYLEGIPVSLSVTVAESCRGGYEASLVCQTNLNEPDYAYWEFRDYLKRLADDGYIGRFMMHECGLNDDDCGDCLRYEYRFPVPDDGNISPSLIECVISRFLNDVSHAATAYFELFFYPLPAHPHVEKNYDAPNAQRLGCGGTSKVIPFPLNRRNKTR